MYAGEHIIGNDATFSHVNKAYLVGIYRLVNNQ